FHVVQRSAALRCELADVSDRDTQEAAGLRPLGVTVRLRSREFSPRSISVFERDLCPETRGRLDGDSAHLVLASSLAEQACGVIADEHPPIAECPRPELLPEVQLALAPGKPQGTGHAVEVLADGCEVTTLTDFIREKRQHALRQGWRRREQVV